MRKIGLKLLVSALMLLGCVGVMQVALTSNAWANPTNICDDPLFSEEDSPQHDLWIAAGCMSPEDKDKTLMPVIMNIIQVVLAMIGIIAVIVLIYGGITFVISTGESSKVQRAKNIILYAIVGLVVASLAFAIVHFVSINIGEH